ncbi:MAG: NADH:ubiquinone reductase (Na(+)-transporting) subunit F, partial [Chlamydiia bacterium]|nr:NADH:ubiquinone reductase (Na(+)-transporting) subunit F [Chlamydiia bacterium]
RLSCQCKVKNDLHVKIPESLLELKEFSGKVISNQNVATFIKELIVQIDPPPTYRPGDYLQFHVPEYHTCTDDWKSTMDSKYLPDWEKYHLFGHTIDFAPSEPTIRAYSMASHPAEGNLFKFNIRIATPPIKDGQLVKNIPWGICSTYTFGLKPGDQIKLSGPYGESHMKDDQRELIFLIGGAGSSFGRSHILDLFQKGTQRSVTLWYGARSLKENIYQEEYQNLDQNHPNFTYHLVLSEPDPQDIEGGWPKDDPTKTAFLFKAFELGQLKNMEVPEDCLYYVCGPPMHNKSIIKLLDDYGVSKENIVLDDFGN